MRHHRKASVRLRWLQQINMIGEASHDELLQAIQKSTNRNEGKKTGVGCGKERLLHQAISERL